MCKGKEPDVPVNGPDFYKIRMGCTGCGLIFERVREDTTAFWSLVRGADLTPEKNVDPRVMTCWSHGGFEYRLVRRPYSQPYGVIERYCIDSMGKDVWVKTAMDDVNHPYSVLEGLVQHLVQCGFV